MTINQESIRHDYNKIVELTNEEQSLKGRVERQEEQLNKPPLDKLAVEQFLSFLKMPQT